MTSRIFHTLTKNKLLQWIFFININIILLFGSSLTYWGDSTTYKCYGEAFIFDKIPSSDRAFCKQFVNIADEHTYRLPPEYPILTLIPFSIPLLFHPLYNLLFGLEMLTICAFLFWYLQRKKGTAAAVIFLYYLLIGAFTTALSRFDLIPACLLLLTMHMGLTKRFSLAYAALAFATLFKLFPIAFLFPLFLYEQSSKKSYGRPSYSMNGLFLFFFICLTVTSISLMINVRETMNPLRYFLLRPVEIESLPASIMLGLHMLHLSTFSVARGFGSINIYPTNNSTDLFHSPLIMRLTSLFFLGMFLLGLGWICYKNYQKKVSLEKSFLLIILLLLLTGKVFSPQYVIWIIPFIAYLFPVNVFWVARWTLFLLLTTVVYPFAWLTIYLFPLILIRNLVLVYISYICFNASMTSKKRR